VADTGIDLPRIAPHSFNDAVQLAKLSQQHATTEFIHTVIRAEEPIQVRFADLLLVRRTQRAQIMKTRSGLEEKRVVGYYRAALACGNGFVYLQAVDSNVADGSDRPALVGGAYALCAVLDDAQPVFSRYCQNRVHVTRVAL